MPRGWFITFEGGEGTGKSTQIRLLAEHLRARGRVVVVTREPGGTPVAEAARAVLLDPGLEPDGLSELFLLEAARHDLVEAVIRPALECGEVLLCDRYADSSIVYQGMVRGVGEARTAELNRIATGGLQPDLTIVLDLDHESGVERARSRNAEGDGSESRLDDEPAAFHRRVREGFLSLAEREPARIRVVSADGGPEEVFERILAALPEGLR
ncbi:MAG: dTMP kinase [Acidobacteria bacterium]|nr:dTMP kinase [Acidobacteriota bacterium]